MTTETRHHGPQPSAKRMKRDMLSPRKDKGNEEIDDGNMPQRQ
jgi:hypothetical protein